MLPGYLGDVCGFVDLMGDFALEVLGCPDNPL